MTTLTPVPTVSTRTDPTRGTSARSSTDRARAAAARTGPRSGADRAGLLTAEVTGHQAGTRRGRRTSREDRTETGPADEHVVLHEPTAGSVVPVSAGRQLIVRFRPRVGSSRWRVTERPEHLMLLSTDTAEMRFLVFGGGTAPGRLRLERVDPAGGRVHETRDVLVVPVG